MSIKLGTIDSVAVAGQWKALEDQLLQWENNPQQLEDEGLTSPSLPIIQLARATAAGMRERGLSVPARVVPNGEGGIVFEGRSGKSFERVEINQDGAVEWATFLDGRLLSRQRFT